MRWTDWDLVKKENYLFKQLTVRKLCSFFAKPQKQICPPYFSSNTKWPGANKPFQFASLGVGMNARPRGLKTKGQNSLVDHSILKTPQTPSFGSPAALRRYCYLR
jgi:hypothetical protein